MSWVEKNRKINNRGWGVGGETIIRDLRVSTPLTLFKDHIWILRMPTIKNISLLLQL